MRWINLYFWLSPHLIDNLYFWLKNLKKNLLSAKTIINFRDLAKPMQLTKNGLNPQFPQDHQSIVQLINQKWFFFLFFCRMWWTITGNFGNILPIDWSKTYTREKYLPVLNLNEAKVRSRGSSGSFWYASSRRNYDEFAPAFCSIHEIRWSIFWPSFPPDLKAKRCFPLVLVPTREKLEH